MFLICSVFGILNINKPVGKTSRDVVTRVVQVIRRATGTKIKAGHAGTLDPIASGVLVVCLGKATKLIQYVQRPLKKYTGRFELDVTSPSADIETEVTTIEKPQRPQRDEIEGGLSRFIGNIQQTPPAYSAISINGKRAYELARKGVEFEIKSKQVSIQRITVLDYRYPELILEIECGSGTYIRSLGRDIARSLDSDAVMTGLVRNGVGGFMVEDALDYEKLEFELIEDSIQNPAKALQELPQIQLDDQAWDEIRNGRFVPASHYGWSRESLPNELAAINSRGELVAVLEPRGDQLKASINLV